jgi:hypothetical protein
MFKTTGQVIIAIISIIFISSLFYSFVSKGFYGYTMKDWDLRRLPLIKPNELTSATGHYWNIKFDPPLDIEELKGYGLNIDSVGIVSDFILLYCPGLGGTTGNHPLWIIYDNGNKKEYTFDNRPDFQDHLKTYDILNAKFHKPAVIYKEFKETLKLPREWEPYIDQEKKERYWDIW